MGYQVTVDQAEICLVNQGGRLEGLPRSLMSQPGGSQLPQFIVDQWQELIGGGRHPTLNRAQNPGDVAHGPPSKTYMGYPLL